MYPNWNTNKKNQGICPYEVSYIYIYVSGILEEEEKGTGAEEVFEEIMFKNIQKLMKDIIPEIQEAQLNHK